MKREKLTGVVSAVAILTIGGAFWAQAGNLNPPAGPVSPTGVTLTQIYDAVQDIEVGNGAAPNSVWVMIVSGVMGEAHQLEGIPKEAIQISGVDLIGNNNFMFGGGGGGGGQFGLDFFQVSMVPDSTLPDLAMRVANVLTVPEVRVQEYVIPGVGQEYELKGEYILTNAVFESLRVSDSTEDVGFVDFNLVMTQLCIKRAGFTPAGAIGPMRSMCWNFGTNSSCSCP